MSPLLRQKLIMTAKWAFVLVASAMGIDYLISIVLLDNPAGYTPFVTFAIATLVTVPSVYIFVDNRFNLQAARDDVIKARNDTLAALTLTECARTEAEREREAAIQANLAKSQFLANMSHELRTPLNAILGYSELLSLDRFAAKRVEYSGIIHKSGEHLLGLIEDLLDLSKIEAGQLKVDGDLVDLYAVINDCFTLVKPRADDGRVNLVRSLTPGLPFIVGNERGIKQVVLNLLTNAIKFTPQFRKVEVFGFLQEDGALLFGVRDEGVGIAKSELPKVFERFGQARHTAVMGEKGTGLGLPIVKGIVEAHGGRLTLLSDLGTGTRVTVRIPAERLRDADATAPAKTA